MLQSVPSWQCTHPQSKLHIKRQRRLWVRLWVGVFISSLGQAQRALKQKLNKHYLDLGLALRLLESLGVAETKINFCLLGFHFRSETGLFTTPGLVQNTSTGQREVQVSTWRTWPLPQFHDFGNLFLKLKAQLKGRKTSIFSFHQNTKKPFSTQNWLPKKLQSKKPTFSKGCLFT